MIHELGQTFFIMQAKDAFTICNIILPNSDQHDREFGAKLCSLNELNCSLFRA